MTPVGTMNVGPVIEHSSVSKAYFNIVALQLPMLASGVSDVSDYSFPALLSSSMRMHP